MSSRQGPARILPGAVGVFLTLALSCATTPWPDEPGVPVELSLAANVDAGDAFLSALTAARHAQGLSAPIVTPRYQPDIRTFAQDLQAGRTSAAGAQRAIESWGRAAFRRPVETWVVDCGAGQPPKLPASLVDRPAAVVFYAAAHFRPRSQPGEQCAVLVVALTDKTELVQFDSALR